MHDIFTTRTIEFPFKKSTALLRGGIVTRDQINPNSDVVILDNITFAIAKRMLPYTHLTVINNSNRMFVKSGDEDALDIAYSDNDENNTIEKDYNDIKNELTTEDKSEEKNSTGIVGKDYDITILDEIVNDESTVSSTVDEINSDESVNEIESEENELDNIIDDSDEENSDNTNDEPVHRVNSVPQPHHNNNKKKHHH